MASFSQWESASHAESGQFGPWHLQLKILRWTVVGRSPWKYKNTPLAFKGWLSAIISHNLKQYPKPCFLSSIYSNASRFPRGLLALCSDPIFFKCLRGHIAFVVMIQAKTTLLEKWAAGCHTFPIGRNTGQ